MQLKVTGWRKSKASSNEDGGVSSLTSWLERRAAIKKKSPVRIRKSRVDGDALIVTASGEDARFISMAHNLSFAGAPVTIETLSATGRGSTPSGRAPMTFSFLRNGEAAHSKDDSKLSAAEITEKFQAVLASRYVPDVKFLDLSDLASHPEIKAMGFTGNPFSRPSFFPALLKVVNQSFATPEAKEEAVHSVSLARNGLHRITPIRPLPQTFPHLKNLDLSGNLFERINAIAGWKTEFPQLEHIILTETKLEANVPDLRAQLIRWYPKLHMIDQVEITAEESAAARTVKPIPPTRPPVWEDRDQVGEKFLVDFYAGFDNDRKTLVNEYYDEKSRFSLSVNTSALRDPAAAPDAPKNQSWGQYIPQSRNLTRISHAAARAKRLHRGREDIARVFMSLPTTRHPSFGPMTFTSGCSNAGLKLMYQIHLANIHKALMAYYSQSTESSRSPARMGKRYSSAASTEHSFSALVVPRASASSMT